MIIQFVQKKLPELRRGGLPGVVSVAAKRRMPPVQFKRLVMTGESFSAAEAQQLGLVDIVASSAAEAQRKVDSILQRLASLQPSLLQSCKSSFPLASVEEALVDMRSHARRGGDAIADGAAYQHHPASRRRETTTLHGCTA